MDNVVILTSDSDSDYSDESNEQEREEEIYDSEHFMNNILKKDYEISRNRLFTKDIEQIDIIIDSFSQNAGNLYNYIFKLDSLDANTGGLNLYKNVIGINLIKSCVVQGLDTSHFIDIIIPQIPYKACIQNAFNHNLIDRICMSKGNVDKMIDHEPEILKNNYFFPISLAELNIKIYTSGSETFYTDCGHSSFIFRLTVLKNLELLK